MIDFPPPTGVGQAFTAPNGTVWIWDGVKWTGTGNPWTSVRYRNRIINGDMAVDQRNGGAIVSIATTNPYIIDRWKCSITAPIQSKVQAGRNSGGPVTAGYFPYSLLWQTTTAYSIVASDYAVIYQSIEGVNFNDVQWGTVNAQPIVLEFWARSSQTGTFGGVIQNSAGTRTYAFTYAIAAANTWTKFRISIPGDTAGTWAVADNTAALLLMFSYGTGATYSTAAGSWTAGNFLSASGAASILGTLNAVLYITGVALMVGAAASNAEPEFKKYSDNLLDCQRYFQAITGGQLYYYGAVVGAPGGTMINFPVTMRAVPTVTPTYTSQTNITSPGTSQQNTFGFLLLGSATAVGTVSLVGTFTADADF